MKNFIKHISLYSCLILYALNAHSDSDEHHHDHSDDEHHSEHGAHVHGAAILNIVAENKTLLIELETPAMNVLGFEHAPKNEEQHHIVEQANEQFESYLSVLSIPDKQCKQTTSDLEFAHETHDDEHHHGHHDGHHEEKESDTHSEYHLNYTVNCESLDNLKLKINLFSNFPGFEHVDLNWIYDQKQGAKELDAANTVITF